MLAVQQNPQTRLAIEQDATDAATDIIEDIIDITNQTNAQKQLQCQSCNVTAMTESQLETHVRIKHTIARKFSCNACEFVTNYSKVSMIIFKQNMATQ